MWIGRAGRGEGRTRGRRNGEKQKLSRGKRNVCPRDRARRARPRQVTPTSDPHPPGRHGRGHRGEERARWGGTVQKSELPSLLFPRAQAIQTLSKRTCPLDSLKVGASCSITPAAAATAGVSAIPPGRRWWPFSQKKTQLASPSGGINGLLRLPIGLRLACSGGREWCDGRL